MNSLISNRVLNHLLLLLSVAAIIVITAQGIQMLYQFFQFVETTVDASIRQADQFISYRH